MKNFKIIFVMSCALLFFFSCTNEKRRNADKFQFEGELKQSDIEITKAFIYLFPSPGEILDRFYGTEFSFLSEHTSNPNDAVKYLSSKDKGLNLGVYLTDMAYAALFSRSSEAVEYLDVIKNLSNELNISSSTFESLIERSKNNMGNRDSLIEISNQVFYNMVEFMEGAGMENTIAIVSCGAYVESMYLALNSVEKFDSENLILNQIAELKFPVENLLSHAESVSDDPNVQSILMYVTELNDLFSELESKSSVAEKTEPGVISFSGGKAPELNAENFQEMKSAVIRVRDYITGK